MNGGHALGWRIRLTQCSKALHAEQRRRPVALYSMTALCWIRQSARSTKPRKRNNQHVKQDTALFAPQT